MADDLLQNRSSEDHVDDDEELSNLELEVKQMAQSILHHRTTLPDQFKTTFASFLVAQRPVAIPHLDAPSTSKTAETGIAGDRNPDVGNNVKSSQDASLAEEDPEITEKIRLLKLKISSNVSAMPIILKRMNDCISMIDKLDMHNGSTHPAFKRKRTC